MPRSNSADAFTSFSRAHALAMLAAASAGLLLHSAWPAAIVGAASLGVFVALHRGRWTPGGKLGPANAITLLRVSMIVGLVPLCRQAPGPAAALLVLAVFALDGLDGALARRRHEASAFGAYFDMESDALLVLLCALVLFLHGRLGAFVLVPGLLRYAYVLLLMVLPEPAGEAPRSLIGRYAFAVMVVALIASLWPVGAIHRPFAELAALLIVYSFARAIYWSLRPAQRARANRA